MKKYPFTKEFLQDLIDKGLTQEAIGKIINYSDKGVSKILKKFGLQTNRTQYRVNFTPKINLCLNCNIATTNPTFCCRSCSATYTNKNSPKRKRIKTKNC